MPEGLETSERPATVTEAFARDAAGAGSPPATPDESPTPVPASTDAIVPSGEATPSQATASSEPGPLPYERHKAILDGAYKERDQYKAQVEGWKDYEWVRQIPSQEFRSVVERIQRANTDPVGFFRELYTDLANHPTHAQQLRSEAARLLASGRSTAEPDLSPDVEITDGQGQVVGRTFSAERVQALMQRAVQDALNKEITPLKTDYEKRRAKEEQSQQQAQLNQQLDALESDIKEIVGDDAEALKLVSEALLAPENANLDPRRVAVKVFNSHVRQKLTSQAKAEELDALKRKAAASGLNPGAAVVAHKRKVTSLTDPSLTW